MGLLERLGKRASGAGPVLRRAGVTVFGRPRWEIPGWLRFTGDKAKQGAAWADRRRGSALGLFVLFAAVIAAGNYGYHWYKNRPQPVTMAVTLDATWTPRVEESPKPRPITIRFDGSAAPLKSIGKTTPVPITFSPRIEGAWKWTSDRELEFTPRSEWPIGQPYRIELPKKGLVATTTRLSTYELEFTTPAFSLSLEKGADAFYQDPIDPNLKKVVVSVSFTHPVDVDSFEKRIHMTLRARPSTGEADQDYRFTVTYDKLRGTAYLHSNPIVVPEKTTDFDVRIDAGVKAARGGPAYDEVASARIQIPGLYNFFNVQSADLTLVDNERFEPEQVLILETSNGVAAEELQKSLSAWVLPLYSTDEEKKEKRAHRWENETDSIGKELLDKSPALPLHAIASEREFSTTHSFKVQADVGRYIYVSVKKGVKSFGGYILGETWQKTLRIPEYPKQLKILHRGAILSLSGERKVSLVARDVEAVRFEIGRVLPDQLQHVVSQTNGTFAEPSFMSSWQFSDENVTERFTEVKELTNRAPGKAQYPAVDLTKYLSGDGGRRGLFFLRVDSWDPASQSATGASDKRLILLTDLGLLVKDAADGTHDVFVQSIHDGTPVSNVKIEVIGKNGIAIVHAVTDDTGRAELPNLRDWKSEKQPVMYVATKGGDLSFLPYGRSDRYLDMSRFDIGGVSERGRPQGLSAFLFSDRGIYRPGDEIRVGLVVKAADWAQDLTGIPLEAVITDARGVVVRRQTLKLGATGFEEIRQSTLETSPTGTWTVNVHIVKDGKQGGLLGSTTVVVREFLPDRLKIAVHLSSENPDGWVSPKDLKGRVSLRNLFGTAAENRKIRASINLSPVLPTFNRYKEYRFFDPMHAKEGVTDTLADAKTGDDGDAVLDLHLERFAAATYRLRLTAQGFEAEGGRGVTGEADAIVSPLPFLVGTRADGGLHYLNRGTHRTVQIIAIDPRGEKTAAAGLSALVVERKYVSVLTKQDNGTYKYESVKKDTTVSEKPLSIAAEGTKWPLPTDHPGDFALVIRNDKGLDLQRVEWTVAGEANLSRSLEKNAELQIVLKKGDVTPGQEIELSIKAPYTGAGLITIERDKVYAHQWFKTTTTASVQTIKLPDDYEGNGYVSVAFIRDLNSDDIFMSPLSYGVAPFSVSREKRTAEISLEAADLVKPGDDYKIKFKTDRPSKIVVFAVDEGILRVADYHTPDPLGWFFQKRALEVKSAQILDLILPEFSKLMAAPGGDNEAALNANLNPFRRKQDKPVAYWSGVVDAGPEWKELTYPVPEYFNGSLRVMAVAVAADAVGATEKSTLVRGDFVISPNVATFAAPGDEFDVSVGLANNVAGSGDNASVTLSLATSPHLEIIGEAKKTLTIPALHESSAVFRVKATSVLGSGRLTFTASLGNRSSHLSTEMSVRPPVPYMTTIAAGHLARGTADVKIDRQLHPEFRKLQTSISYLPLGLAHGLATYLEKFPYGCTEQITSQGIPAAVLGQRKDFGFDPEVSRKSVDKVIDTLRSRQNEDGGFGLWAANPMVSPFASVYAIHFLTEAKERGFAVPPDVLANGLKWLSELSGSEGDSLYEERIRAYAIYVLTRNGNVTTSFAAALQKRLQNAYAKQWKGDLAGIYLAATYRLLKQEKTAAKILEGSKLGQPQTADYDAYYDSLVRDAQLLYLLSRHFPERLPQITAVEIRDMVAPILSGQFHTLSSAYTILALDAYATATSQSETGKLGISELDDGKQAKALSLPAGLLPVADFSGKARGLQFTNDGAFDAFWMATEAGFDTTLPAKPMAQKIEVYREYTDDKGKPIGKVTLGDEVQVHIKLRSLTTGPIGNIAILDLLPGGFEVVVVPPPARENDSGGGGDDSGMHEGEADNRANDNEGGGDGEGQGEGDGDEGGGNDNHGGNGDADPGDAQGAYALPITQPGSTWSPQYGDVREDRVVLYGTALTEAREYVYNIKAVSSGQFVSPPIQAESLYDRSVLSRAMGGRIAVVKK